MSTHNISFCGEIKYRYFSVEKKSALSGAMHLSSMEWLIFTDKETYMKLLNRRAKMSS